MIVGYTFFLTYPLHPNWTTYSCASTTSVQCLNNLSMDSPKLTHFTLAETGISQLPNMQHLVAPKKIYIHQNNLTTLHDLYDLPLTAVKLARNPLLCDKSLCWLRMWCFVKPVLAELDSTSVKCASPEHLQEAVFVTVHPVDMECYNGTAYICTSALLVKAKGVLS